MPTRRTTRKDKIARRRELHARIAQLRRRLDRRLEQTVSRSLRFVPLKKHVQKRPLEALLATAGIGWLISRVLPAGRLSMHVGASLRQFGVAALEKIWAEVSELLGNYATGGSSENEGEDPEMTSDGGPGDG